MGRKKTYNDFVIDRLTNSIVNTISGDSFQTNVTLLLEPNLKQVIKKNGGYLIGTMSGITTTVKFIN